MPTPVRKKRLSKILAPDQDGDLPATTIASDAVQANAAPMKRTAPAGWVRNPAMRWPRTMRANVVVIPQKAHGIWKKVSDGHAPKPSCSWVPRPRASGVKSAAMMNTAIKDPERAAARILWRVPSLSHLRGWVSAGTGWFTWPPIGRSSKRSIFRRDFRPFGLGYQ